MDRSPTSSAPPWSTFYERTLDLPKPELTAKFLAAIPQAGRVLDFGAGSGRWAAAFMRDRPDMTVDVLDQNIDQAALIPDDWRGDKIKASFQEFSPTAHYDGVWAFASLFFMKNDELQSCFHKLASALNDGGTLAFTMVDDCHAARAAKFHGLSKDAILEMAQHEGLEVTALELREKTPYGASKVPIPTYFVTAQKMPKK